MTDEQSDPDLVELTRESMEATNLRDFDAAIGGAPGRVQEQWAFTVLRVEGVIVRVVARRDIEEARAAAERLAAERE